MLSDVHLDFLLNLKIFNLLQAESTTLCEDAEIEEPLFLVLTQFSAQLCQMSTIGQLVFSISFFFT